MQVHLKDMVEVTEEKHKNTENLLNCLMQSWCRILNATGPVTSLQVTMASLLYMDCVTK